MNLLHTTLLLTRPRSASRRFAKQVEAKVGRFGCVVVSPLMRIVPVLGELAQRDARNWIFTSQNGVEQVVAQCPEAGGRAWCVGARTAEVAGQSGFQVVAVAKDAVELAREMLSDPPSALVVHAAGRHRRGDLAERLSTFGIETRVACVYDQIACELSDEAKKALALPGDIVVPVFSPRSARLLFDAVKNHAARLNVVAISPAAAAEWQKSVGVLPQVAATPDADGILLSICSLFDAEPPLEAMQSSS